MVPDIARVLKSTRDLVGARFVVADSAERLEVKVTAGDLTLPLPLLEECSRLGASVTLELDANGEKAALSADSGKWAIVEDFPSPVLPFDPDIERHDSSEVLARSSLGSATCSFAKEPWGDGWTGWSAQSLEDWIAQAGPFEAARILLEKGPSAIKLMDWKGAPRDLGFLIVGGITTQPNAMETLPWPETTHEWLLRAAFCDCAPLDKSSTRVAYLVGSAGLRLLAEETVPGQQGRTTLILDRGLQRQYELPKTGELSIETARSMRKVLLWVSEEPVRARLLAARKVVAQEWTEITTPLDSAAIKTKATLTYRAAVDDRIATVLVTQATFEKHVTEFSEKYQVTGRAMDKLIDEVLQRTVTALLAIFVTSVIAKDVRDWPVLVAAIGVALYVAAASFVGLRSIWVDLSALEDLAKVALDSRPEPADKAPGITLERQISRLRQRVVQRGKTMAALSILVVVIGVMLYFFVQPASSTEEADVVPTPTAGVEPAIPPFSYTSQPPSTP